jgi:hypothetical protein
MNGGNMRIGRKAVVGLFGAVGISLLASGALADTASLSLPPEETISSMHQVRLVSDKQFGFAPMTVNLSGMLQGDNGDLAPMNGGQQIRVVVESPFMRVQSSTGISPLVSDIHYEAFSAGPATPSPFRRAFEIRRPGTYSFRVQVITPGGEVLSSNEVSVRVM